MMTREFFQRATRTLGENFDLLMIAYSFYKQYRGKDYVVNEKEYDDPSDIDIIEDCLKEVHRNMDSQMFCRHFSCCPMYAQGFAKQEIKDRVYYKMLNHEFQYDEEHNEKLKSLKEQFGEKTKLERLEGEEFDYAVNWYIEHELCPRTQYAFLEALVYNRNIVEVIGEDNAYEYISQIRSDQRIERGDNTRHTRAAYLIKKDDRIIRDFGVSFDKEKAEAEAQRIGGYVSKCDVTYSIWLGVGEHFTNP